jgi:hypothetical protein
MFHGAPIENGVYKVKVHGVMFHDQTLMFFPNAKNDPPQILKDVKGQFTF